MTVTRYHPLLVALHWLIAPLIGLQLIGGYLFVAQIPNTDPGKLSILAVHMGFGTATLVLLVIRLLTRFMTAKPAPLPSQQHGAGKLARPVHALLYFAAIATAMSGWYTGFLIAHLYDKPGSTLPADFASYPSRQAHIWLALALFLLVVVHIAAAVKEGMGDGGHVFSRVWFGKRRN